MGNPGAATRERWADEAFASGSAKRPQEFHTITHTVEKWINKVQEKVISIPGRKMMLYWLFAVLAIVGTIGLLIRGHHVGAWTGKFTEACIFTLISWGLWHIASSSEIHCSADGLMFEEPFSKRGIGWSKIVSISGDGVVTVRTGGEDVDLRPFGLRGGIFGAGASVPQPVLDEIEEYRIGAGKGNQHWIGNSEFNFRPRMLGVIFLFYMCDFLIPHFALHT